MATVDEGAVRNTRDIDLLVRRSDLPTISAALEGAGFVLIGHQRFVFRLNNLYIAMKAGKRAASGHVLQAAG